MATVEVVKGGKGLSGLAFDGSHRLHCVGSQDGRVYVEEGGVLLAIGDTSGNPQNLTFDHINSLYVCDHAHCAVLLLKDDGSLQTVVQEYEGKTLKGPHSAAIDSAGNLFFTDSGPFGETSLLEPTGSVFVVTGEGSNRLLRPLAFETLGYPTGIAVGPKDTAVFVAEMSMNRILRFAQRPAGVWHPTVFHQFSGRMGPTSLAWDDARNLLYVGRLEVPELAEKGVVSVLNSEGALVKEYSIPGGPEVTGLALSPDGTYLLVSESTTNTVHRISL